jgi:hypothetical protein
LTPGNGSASSETFRDIALDALSAVENQSDFILTHGLSPPSFLKVHPPRSARRKSLISSFKPKPAFLYIHPNALLNAEANSQNHLYLLKCPGCSRTSFTSLQGLLNHARLTHSLEWGTHDECIRACAIPDNDLDVENGTEVRLGPGGILPALQTIFKIAVGATQNKGEEDPNTTKNTTAPSNNEGSSQASSHLIQTLGLHEDSPALAPFLGKQATRRQINVFDTTEELDLETLGTTARQAYCFKMTLASRNFREDLISENFQTNVVENGNNSNHTLTELVSNS